MVEAEATRKADEEARRLAEAESKRKAEESLRRLAEVARLQAIAAQRRSEEEARKRAEDGRLAQDEVRRKTAEYQRERQLATTTGLGLVARSGRPRQQTVDTIDNSSLDRSFNELFEQPEEVDPTKTREILCPIIESPTPPFQRLLQLPMSVPRPLASQATARHRSAPPEFRPSLPVLPKHLHHLADAHIIPSAFHTSHKARRPMPSWLLTGLVAFLMAITGITVVSYIMPSKTANAVSPPAPSAQPPTNPVPALATPAANTAGVSKRLVELTGFRVHPDKSGKTSVQYVVINHGDTEMHGLTAYIVLRSSTAKPFQAPLANFTVRLPAMAALESKDLTTLVESPIDRGVPDWTELKAEVRIEQ